MDSKIEMKYNHVNNRGFSLIEVVIALGIFSIGMLAIMGLQVISTNSNSKAGNQMSGINIAADKIETLMSLSYSDSDLNDDDSDGFAGLNDATAGTADGSDTQDAYSIFWNVAVDSPINSTKSVTVIVSSQGLHGQTVSLSFIKPNII